MSLKQITIAVTTVLLLIGCSDSSQENELNSLVSASSYDLVDLENKSYAVQRAGNNFTLTGLDDKIIIFDIFATWCPPCRTAAPNLTSLQKKYDKDVKIMGILIEEEKSTEDVKRFANTYGAEYTISNSEDNRALSRAIARAVDVGQNFPIPLMVMYYKGKYINHYVGVVPEEMIESDIRRVLNR